MIREFRIADIEFYVNKKRHKFRVLNDMPDTFGFSIEGAVDNWLARTNDFSAQNFCDYVNNKNTGYICCLPTKQNINKYLNQKQ